MTYTMPKLKLLMTAFLLTSGAAFAAVTPEQIAADYTAQGYTRVEIRIGPTQMKVEAIRGTEKLEVILDIATGAVLKSETETVGAFENTRPGISVRDRNRDFVRAGVSSDDDGTDDQGGDNDDDGDASGSDDGPDHDANDDDSGDDNSSDDHGGSDDNGGSDDHGGNSGQGGGDDDKDKDNSGSGNG